MTEQEALDLCLGVRWVSRGETLKGFDCWGLVRWWFDKVHCVILPCGERYHDLSHYTDTQAYEEISTLGYTPSTGKCGDIAQFFDKHGNFVHVGVVVGGMILHANGRHDRKINGVVQLDTKKLLTRAFGAITYHAYNKDC